MSNVTPLKRYVPPISPMPDWARWTSIDSDGCVCAWENRPNLAAQQWLPNKLDDRYVILGTNPPMRAFWKTSLTPIHSPTVPTSRSFADGQARAQLRRVILIGSALLAAILWYAVVEAV